ncbi:MAG TPA: TonB-dependent receptor [Thermoanaerobaculia bacterium]|nr:TonB-dependent receptor [Thermoanaerobaculia bacterium]
MTWALALAIPILAPGAFGAQDGEPEAPPGISRPADASATETQSESLDAESQDVEEGEQARPGAQQQEAQEEPLRKAQDEAQPEAQREPEIEIEIDVVGLTPIDGLGVARERAPWTQHRLERDELGGAGGDLASALERSLPGVSLGSAQGNPLQPELFYRGFSSSPLLGASQELSVYEDGVRVNEVFGDVVDWASIPAFAVERVELAPGSNPLFGLNTLGGAIAVVTRSGFDHPRVEADLGGGSWRRRWGALSAGGGGESWALWGGARLFAEDGWRDFSPSKTRHGLAKLSRRTGRGQWSLTAGLADNDLIGNGSTPVQLLELDRAAVFTHPDQTENRLVFPRWRVDRQLGSSFSLEGVAYFRSNRITTFNADAFDDDDDDDDGDGDGDGDDGDEDGDGEVGVDEAGGSDHGRVGGASLLAGASSGLIAATGGIPAPGGIPATRAIGVIRAAAATAGDEPVLDAVDNRSRTDQQGWGLSLQLGRARPQSPSGARWLAGVAWDAGRAEFASSSELATLTPTRTTIPSGMLLPGSRVEVDADTERLGLFAAFHASPLPSLAITAQARYSTSRLELFDQLGAALDGDHSYDRLLPSLGLAWQLRERARSSLTLFGGVARSSRIPTPVELTCADPEAPCRLPNAFVSDPPLEQVVTTGGELGLRGAAGATQWSSAYFRSDSRDDLVFVSSGASTSQGFFRNVDSTRRSGLELWARGRRRGVSWRASYTLVDATFEDDLTLASPHHPLAQDGEIEVEAGDRLPGVARHQLRGSVSSELTRRIAVDAALRHDSSRYRRGDEANLLDPVPGDWLADLAVRYAPSPRVEVRLAIDNVFDREVETFGALGDASEVLGDRGDPGDGSGERFDDPRFSTPGEPRAITLSVRLRWAGAGSRVVSD